MGRARTQTQSSQDASQCMDTNEEASFDQTEVIDPDKIIFTRCLLLNRSMTEEEIKAVYAQIFTDDPQLEEWFC